MKHQKILLFDIEVFANVAFVWGKWEQNVIEFLSQWYMLSFAYKWGHEKQTHVVSLPDFKGYKGGRGNEKKLMQVLWDLVNEADVVIAHNGASFDVKKMNAKFVEHGFPPPSPYKVIDTKLVAKRYFAFNGNTLNDLAIIFGLEVKKDTGGFKTWIGCDKGEVSAWNTMCKYNKHDVVLLEQVYLKMRPYMTNHPTHTDIGTCRNCESTNLQRRGFSDARAGGKLIRKPRFSCNDCGAWTISPVEKETK